MTKVLILCPIRNEVTRVPRMIESVLRQTFTDWELIFVDNASTDGTTDLIMSARMSDARIQIRSFSKSVNVHKNFERAFSEAARSNAEFIQILAGDDLLGSDSYLEKAIGSLCTTSASLVAGQVEHFAEEKVLQNDDFRFLDDVTTETRLEVFAALNYWTCNLLYAFFRRESFLGLIQNPVYSFTDNLSSDWWFSLGAMTNLHSAFNPDVVYRKFSKGISYGSEHYTANQNPNSGSTKWAFVRTPWEQLGDRRMMMSTPKWAYFIALFSYRELASAVVELVRR